jgi:PEGA domain
MTRSGSRAAASVRRLCLVTAALLSASLGVHGVAAADSIVAVEELQTSRADLSAQLKKLLTHYLDARAAAVPRWRVIPRTQVRELMARRLRAGLARCGGPSRAGAGSDSDPCPVELGRELAANKVLLPRVIGAGGTCVLTLTYYDVRSATTEAAATVTAKRCDEVALALSLGVALAQLTSKLRPASRPTSQPASQPAPRPRKVSVYFSSRPSGTPVTIDGKKRGSTPVRLDLEAGPHKVTLGGNFPYAAANRTIDLQDPWERIHVKLELEPIDPLERATATEWFSLGLGGGFLRDAERQLFVIAFRAATFKWRYLFVSGLDGFIGLSSSGKGDDYKLWRSFSIGSRVGLPLYLGSSGKHQLLLGVGLHYTSFEEPGVEDRSLLSLVPGAEYVYAASNGAALLGGGVHAVLPVAGQLGEARPVQVLFTVRAGFSLTPLIRSYERKERAKRGGD